MMDSKYAYVRYLQNMDIEEVNSKSEIVQLVKRSFEGQTDLVSISEFNRLKEDFPDRVTGDIIKQDNLFNMLNLCYENMRNEYNNLPEKNERLTTQFEAFKSEFEQEDGTLKPTNNVDDLANKVFNLQWSLRTAQSSYSMQVQNTENGQHHI